MSKHHLITTSIFALFALAGGFVLSGTLVRNTGLASNIIVNNAVRIFGSSEIGKLTYRDALPADHGRSAIIDLDKREITLYEDAVATDTFDIISVGPAGSPWEAPSGRYKVIVKELSHYSPLAKMTFPHSVQIFGNTFVHGGPYRAMPGDSTESGKGSLRLRDDDSLSVYDFLSAGDIVVVKSKMEPVLVSVERLASIGALKPTYIDLPKSTLKLNSLSYYVADLDTGEVILSHDEDKVRPIASISKLFTTLVAVEDYPKNSVVEVSARAIGALGASGGLLVGERMSISDALYPLLLESSNDMAEAIAESLGHERFMARMNDKAKNLGLYNTSFRDPSGLSQYNRSSARDLFTLAQYLYRTRPDILHVARTYSYELRGLDGSQRHFWNNHNKFVLAQDERYIGGKTGYIDESGLTSVSLFSLPLAEFSKKNIAIILLNSVNRDRDNKLILNALYDTLTYEDGITLRTIGKIPSEPLFNDEETRERASLILVGSIYPDPNPLNNNAILFKHAGFIKDADIAVANILGPVSDIGYDLGNRPSYRFAQSFAKNLHDAGIDIVTTASGHAGDWGKSAISDSIKVISEAGIYSVGTGRDRTGAESMRRITAQGMTFGFMNVAVGISDWLTTPDNVPVVNSIPSLDAVDTVRFVQQVRDNAGLVDFLAVTYNIDHIANSVNRDGAESFARSLVDAGADIVVGVGSHSIDGIERYKEGVIAYGLGDFIYDQSQEKSMLQGIALEVLLQSGKIVEVNGAQVLRDEKGIPYLSEDDL